MQIPASTLVRSGCAALARAPNRVCFLEDSDNSRSCVIRIIHHPFPHKERRREREKKKEKKSQSESSVIHFVSFGPSGVADRLCCGFSGISRIERLTGISRDGSSAIRAGERLDFSEAGDESMRNGPS